MILDSLSNADRYLAVHPGLIAAFNFLRQNDLNRLPKGRNPIDGDRLYAIVVQAAGGGKAKALIEAHRTYIDVQFAVAGTDVMGWRDLAECRQLKQAYDAKGDAVLYTDPPAVWFDLPPGAFAIFFPWDGHSPMAADGVMLHKVVVKVAMDWR
jgi:YhcH/YjgK/YiaL family protein